jgi:hypothetical protein
VYGIYFPWNDAYPKDMISAGCIFNGGSRKTLSNRSKLSRMDEDIQNHVAVT